MKKIYGIFIVILFIFASCASQESVQQEVQEEPVVEEVQEEVQEEVVEEENTLFFQEIKKSTVHNRGAEGLAIYDSSVVTGSWNNNIVISSLTGETMKLIKQAHKSDVIDIEVEANGTFFVSVGLDRTVKIWSTENGTLLKSISTPVNAIDASISTGVDILIAVAALNGMVYIYDYESGKQVSLFRATSQYSTTVQFIDKNRIAAAGADGYIVIWDISNSKELIRFKAHNQRINVLRISKDASMLASAGWDKSVKIWNVNDSSNVATFSTKEQNAIESLEFSFNDKFILAGDRSGNIITWNISTKELHSIQKTGIKRVYDLRLSSDGNKAVATGYDTTVRFYDVK